MARILANDGIDPSGLAALVAAGFEVETTHIPQDKLDAELNNYDAVLVRSATKIRKDLIDKSPNIKLICRGGVGMDNIDVEYARSTGVQVSNTPAASSNAVAELVFAHLFGVSRFLHLANREMPKAGNTNFKGLKKSYSKGIELRGKYLGILGFGRIGRRVAEIGLGIGMKVGAFDIAFGAEGFEIPENLKDVDQFSSIGDLMAKSDVVSVHIPGAADGTAALKKEQFDRLQDGTILVNCGRGGTVDELAMMEALENGKLAYAALDVFENEPTPREELLNHPRVSVSPHIGASTVQAQLNIGLELADIVSDYFKN